MNLNIGCIEIVQLGCGTCTRQMMNLNIGCIEIIKSCLFFSDKFDEP